MEQPNFGTVSGTIIFDASDVVDVATDRTGLEETGEALVSEQHGREQIVRSLRERTCRHLIGDTFGAVWAALYGAIIALVAVGVGAAAFRWPVRRAVAEIRPAR